MTIGPTELLAVATVLRDAPRRWGVEPWNSAANFCWDFCGEESELWLAFDALTFGYSIREAEVGLSERLVIFDDDYVDRLATAAKEDPVPTLSAGALAAVKSLPGVFSLDIKWRHLVRLAMEVLVEERQPKILAREAQDGRNPNASLSNRDRKRAFEYGYGLCITASALGIEALPPTDYDIHQLAHAAHAAYET